MQIVICAYDVGNVLPITEIKKMNTLPVMVRRKWEELDSVGMG